MEAAVPGFEREPRLSLGLGVHRSSEDDLRSSWSDERVRRSGSRVATDRFAQQIREITVHLRDTNAWTGGPDKLCTVLAKFHDGDQIRVAQTEDSVMAAISGAARRLHQSLSRRIGRRTEKLGAAVPGCVTEYWIG